MFVSECSEVHVSASLANRVCSSGFLTANTSMLLAAVLLQVTW